MWATDRLSPGSGFEFEYSRVFFGCLLGIGFLIMMMAVSTMMKHRTEIHPNRKALSRATHLVTTGIFRYSRNPIYLGMAIMLMGWFFHLESWICLSGVVLFVAFINTFQIDPEEEALTKIFGEEYKRYKARVRRWL